MQIKNSTNRFGIGAIFLHWLMAVLLIALLALGLYMVRLPISLNKLKLYGWHKEYGMMALFLVILRSIWRISNVIPILSIPWWEKVAARTVHYIFYGFMFAMPLTGWIITSAAGIPVSFFGWFVFPGLILPNAETLHLFQQIHEWLGYGLMASIALHTAAALKHHFINKDNILKRMLS